MGDTVNRQPQESGQHNIARTLEDFSEWMGAHGNDAEKRQWGEIRRSIQNLAGLPQEGTERNSGSTESLEERAPKAIITLHQYDWGKVIEDEQTFANIINQIGGMVNLYKAIAVRLHPGVNPEHRLSHVSKQLTAKDSIAEGLARFSIWISEQGNDAERRMFNEARTAIVRLVGLTPEQETIQPDGIEPHIAMTVVLLQNYGLDYIHESGESSPNFMALMEQKNTLQRLSDQIHRRQAVEKRHAKMGNPWAHSVEPSGTPPSGAER